VSDEATLCMLVNRVMGGILAISIHVAIPAQDAGFAALVAPSLAFQPAVPL